MKSVKFKKIEKSELREQPAWLKETLEAVKHSPFAKMTEEEIGQLCEELAEEAARERQEQEQKAAT